MGAEIIAIVTAVASATAAAAPAGTLLATSALWGLTTVGTLLAAGLSIAGGLLSAQIARQNVPSINATKLIRESTATESAMQRWRMLGQSKITGSFLMHDVSEADEMYQRIHIASHPIQSIVEHRLNDELVTIGADGWVTSPAKWSNNVQIKFVLGGHTSHPFPEILDNFAYALSSDVGFELAQVMIRQKTVETKYMQKTYPGSGRLQWSGVIEGDKTLYDPRSGSSGYTRNAALHALGHLLRPTIDGGCNVAAEFVNMQSFADLAAVCDQQVAGLSGTLARYSTDGIVLYGDDPMPTLAALLTNCDADVYLDNDGRVAVQGGNAVLTGHTTFTREHVVAMDWSTRAPAWRRSNRVIGLFLSSAHNYQEVTAPPVDRVLDTNEARRPVTADLPFAATSRQVQALCKKQLLSADPQYTGKVILTIAGLVAKPTSTVRFDFPEAPQVDFRVTRRIIGEDGLSVTLEVASISPQYDVFELSEEKVMPPLPAISVLEGLLAAPTITESYVTEVAMTGGISAVAITIEYTALTDEVVSTEIQTSTAGANKWTTRLIGDATTGSQDTGPIEAGITYDARIRFVGPGGGASEWSTVPNLLTVAGTPSIDGVQPALSDVPDLSRIVASGTSPDVVAVRSVRFYRSTSDSFAGATRYAEQFLGANAAFSATTGDLQYQTVYYFWTTVTNTEGFEGLASTSSSRAAPPTSNTNSGGE
jgi:hypothetical protein